MCHLVGTMNWGIMDNGLLIKRLGQWGDELPEGTHLAIEYPENQGNSDDALFETAFEAGRFVQAWERPWTKVYRHEVRLCLLHNVIGNDTKIRAALKERYGPGLIKEFKYDTISALAVAHTFAKECKLIWNPLP